MIVRTPRNNDDKCYFKCIMVNNVYRMGNLYTGMQVIHHFICEIVQVNTNGRAQCL